MSPVVSSFVQWRRIKSSSYRSAVNGAGLLLDNILPPNTYSLSPRTVVVAPTNGCGSLPVVLCTLHISPDKCAEGVDVPTAAPPPPGLDWLIFGDGPADTWPVLLGVRLSPRSSCPSCRDELAKLLWLLFMFISIPWLACPRAYSPPPISADDVGSMIIGRKSSSVKSISTIVSRLVGCGRGAKGVTGSVGDSCVGASGKGFARLSCRLRLRAWCGGNGRELLGRIGVDAADLVREGTGGSEGRRSDGWDGLLGVNFRMPRKVLDRKSERKPVGSGSPNSDSEGRVK